MSTLCAPDLLARLEEESVSQLHDVGLVHARHLLAAVARRVVERELNQKETF